MNRLPCDHAQARFYKEFPATDQDKVYKFECSSTMKPTRFESPPGSINIIPGECTISGDIRLSPFYDGKDVMAKVADPAGMPEAPQPCCHRAPVFAVAAGLFLTCAILGRAAEGVGGRHQCQLGQAACPWAALQVRPEPKVRVQR